MIGILRKGVRGEPVRRLQSQLGVAVDGIFGPGTERALRAYQENHGLTPDGVAGPDTFSAMGLHELVLLRRGQRGTAVRRLQEALKVGADGIFGGGTEAAVKAYQQSQGLAADGIAGPRTLARLEFFEEFTEEVVARASVPEDYVDPVVPAGLEADASAIAASKEANEAAAAAEQKKESGGIWATVKGWFS